MQVLQSFQLVYDYVGMDENVADIFTKSLSRPRVEKLVKLLGLENFEE